LYFIHISTSGGTADLYVRADANLSTSGGDLILLGNETFDNRTTSGAEPNYPICCTSRRQMTDSYQLIGSNLGDGDVVWMRFFLSAPPGSAAGIYNNTLDFKAVEYGVSP